MKLRPLEQSLKPETHIYTLCQLLAIQLETIHITSRVVNYNKLATSSINGQLDDTSIIVGEKTTDSDSPNVHEAPKIVIHRQALSSHS